MDTNTEDTIEENVSTAEEIEDEPTEPLEKPAAPVAGTSVTGRVYRIRTPYVPILKDFRWSRTTYRGRTPIGSTFLKDFSRAFGIKILLTNTIKIKCRSQL